MTTILPTTTTLSSMTKHYRYVDQENIDNELLCPICLHPYESPVYYEKCGHTFCHNCIRKHCRRSKKCPICGVYIFIHNLLPVTIRIVLNQLDRLPIKCTRCDETNILRRNISDHEERCPEKRIHCSAADINCRWMGKQKEIKEHLLICAFEKIRPIIKDLRSELHELNKTVCELKEENLQQKERNKFLFTFINNGWTMNTRCTPGYENCILQFIESEDFHEYFPNETRACAICNNVVKRQVVAMHHCGGGLICNTCFFRIR